MGRHPKGSRDWLIARYELAACAVAMGEFDEARKLIGLTRVVYPELGGPDLKARYDALEQSLPQGKGSAIEPSRTGGTVPASESVPAAESTSGEAKTPAGGRRP